MPLTQSDDLVASVDMAEEQPAQIAAVQKIEPAKKKKFAWKKSGGGGQAVADSSTVSGFGPGGLTHSEQAWVGNGTPLLPLDSQVSGQQVCDSLHLVGKLQSPGWLNTVALGVLVHVVDQFSGRHFLVDTGITFIIIPHSKLELSGQGFKLTFFKAEVRIAILGLM